jgi:hypothetical protein
MRRSEEDRKNAEVVAYRVVYHATAEAFSRRHNAVEPTARRQLPALGNFVAAGHDIKELCWGYKESLAVNP